MYKLRYLECLIIGQMVIKCSLTNHCQLVNFSKLLKFCQLDISNLVHQKAFKARMMRLHSLKPLLNQTSLR